MNEYLGKKVNIKVDRPLGSKHPKWDTIYPVNYGYIPGTIAGDGEEIDVYILGESEPLEWYEGYIIAVINRKNDNEYKLVACKSGDKYTKEEIYKQVEFQEKYFASEIGVVKFEKSCGGIIFIIENGEHKYLLLKHHNGGHWSFPKGHIEEGEMEQETALREVYEETGLGVELLNDFRFSTRYSPEEGILKDVIYFIGEANNIDIKCQVEEIKEYKWLEFKEAVELLTYENDKILLKEVEKFLIGDYNYGQSTNYF